MQRFNYKGRWYNLEQYQKLLNPVEKEVETPNVSEESKTLELPVEQEAQEVVDEVSEKIVKEVSTTKPVKKSKKSNKK